jgi:hypothetical protein
MICGTFAFLLVVMQILFEKYLILFFAGEYIYNASTVIHMGIYMNANTCEYMHIKPTKL